MNGLLVLVGKCASMEKRSRLFKFQLRILRSAASTRVYGVDICAPQKDGNSNNIMRLYHIVIFYWSCQTEKTYIRKKKDTGRRPMESCW